MTTITAGCSCAVPKPAAPAAPQDSAPPATHDHGAMAGVAELGTTPPAPPAAAGGAEHDHGAAHTVEGGATVHSQPGQPGDHTVRNPRKAKAFLKRVEQTIKKKYPNQKAAARAGYGPTSTTGTSGHWNSDGKRGDLGVRNHGGVADLSRPGSIMYDKRGHITGVMIVPNEGEALKDFGAGSWHSHGAGGTPMMHIWFNKPLSQSFGG